ncbi:MAG: farnesyl diphosphate synthase [Geminicoccaceae bacterium]
MPETVLAAAMVTVADATERELESLLDSLDGTPERLLAAMRHSTLAAGKRVRPFLVAATGMLFDVAPAASRRVGAAVELIHSYSLVHDDLPAMDDSPLRRGRPSCHVAFDEATAILVGDALQALAFEALARTDWPADPIERVSLVLGLAQAAGAVGMCGGQQLDLEAEKRTLELDAIAELQAKKTGAMIAFSVEAGCILGRATDAERTALLAYARDLGLAFQIKDDLLDAGGDSATIGKTAGQDAARGKATFLSLLGQAGAEARLQELRTAALGRLDIFGGRATLLRQLFDFVINRTA